VPYGRGSVEGPRKPWDKWCKILHSGHFLAAKLAIQKLNLIQKITDFQNIFLKIKLFYMHQYTMTSEIYR
jgi:hypothetical protein